MRRAASLRAMRASQNSDIVSQEVARLMNLVGQVDIQLEEPIEVSDIDADIKGIEQDLSSFIQAHVARVQETSEQHQAEGNPVPYMLSLARSSEDDTVRAIAYFIALTRMILSSSHHGVLPRYIDDLRGMNTQGASSRVVIFREVLLSLLKDEFHFASSEAKGRAGIIVDTTEAVNEVTTFAQIFRSLVEMDISLRIIFHPKSLSGYADIAEKYARYATEYNAGKKKVTNREVPAIPLPTTLAALCMKCGVKLTKDVKQTIAELLGEEYLNPVLFASSDEPADAPALERLAKRFVSHGTDQHATPPVRVPDVKKRQDLTRKSPVK